MQTVICAVCKTPIEDALVVETVHGPVNPGPCLNHANETPVSESSDQILQEVELLM